MDLTAAGRVVFDTTACIYYLERSATDPRCAVLLPVVRAAQAGTVDLVVSTVTVTELLTGPLLAGDREAEAAVRLFVSLLCTVAPVDLVVAERAAAIRRQIIAARFSPPHPASHHPRNLEVQQAWALAAA